MPRAIRAAFLMAAVVLPGSLPAQDRLDPGPWRWLQGTWEGAGQVLGREARFEMRWEQKPGGFAVLTFSNGLLEAVALYRMKDAEIGGAGEGVWMDSRGQRLDIRWEAADSVLTAHWTGSESGRTVYRLVDAGEVVVTDSVQVSNGWRGFGQARYRRVTSPDGRPDQ